MRRETTMLFGAATIRTAAAAAAAAAGRRNAATAKTRGAIPLLTPHSHITMRIAAHRQEIGRRESFVVGPLLGHLDIFHRVVRARRNDDARARASPLGNRVRAARMHALARSHTARNVCIMQSPTIGALNDLPHSHLMPVLAPLLVRATAVLRGSHASLYLSRGYRRRECPARACDLYAASIGKSSGRT